MTTYKYRGITITHNTDSKFGTDYWTAANNHICINGKNPHVHSCSRKALEVIVDAYSLFRATGQCGKYQRSIKNKALRLANIYILS